MNYKVHEVAALFPLLPKGSKPYNDLEEHILTVGQLEPIVVDGETLLDGRNRLAICLDNGIEPKIAEWSSLGLSVGQHEWIYAKNATRRNLTEDQRTAIYMEYNKWVLKNYADENQQRSQFKSGDPAGPGRGKTATLKSASPFQRDRKASNANSTAGKVAAATGVSRYKAQQIINLGKKADGGDAEAKANLNEIKSGLKSLRELKRETRKKVKSQPLSKRIEKAWSCFWKKFDASEKAAITKWIKDNL